jgi:hypothetical protein
VHLEILITDMSRIVIFTSFLSWKNLFETVWNRLRSVETFSNCIAKILRCCRVCGLPVIPIYRKFAKVAGSFQCCADEPPYSIASKAFFVFSQMMIENMSCLRQKAVVESGSWWEKTFLHWGLMA